MHPTMLEGSEGAFCFLRPTKNVSCILSIKYCESNLGFQDMKDLDRCNSEHKVDRTCQQLHQELPPP